MSPPLIVDSPHNGSLPCLDSRNYVLYFDFFETMKSQSFLPYLCFCFRVAAAFTHNYKFSKLLIFLRRSWLIDFADDLLFSDTDGPVIDTDGLFLHALQVVPTRSSALVTAVASARKRRLGRPVWSPFAACVNPRRATVDKSPPRAASAAPPWPTTTVVTARRNPNRTNRSPTKSTWCSSNTPTIVVQWSVRRRCHSSRRF